MIAQRVNKPALEGHMDTLILIISAIVTWLGNEGWPFIPAIVLGLVGGVWYSLVDYDETRISSTVWEFSVKLLLLAVFWAFVEIPYADAVVLWGADDLVKLVVRIVVAVIFTGLYVALALVAGLVLALIAKLIASGMRFAMR